MAAHLDLAARAAAIGAEELYSGNPSKDLAAIVARVRAGRWPLLVNVKGLAPDQCLVVLTLAGYEAMQPRTGFEGDD